MLQAIGTLVPLSLAMALSTIPFLATVVVVLSPRGKATAIPYLIGYVVGSFLVVCAFSFGLSALPHDVQIGPWFGIVEILLGIALIVLAVIQWQRHRRRQHTPSSGAWLDRLERVGPFAALGFALVLNLRPKSLLVAGAAGIAISSQRLEVGEVVVCVIVFTLLGTVTVSVPVILSLVMPKRTSAWLVQARVFLVRSSSLIALVVLIMVGAFVVGAGLARL